MSLRMTLPPSGSGRPVVALPPLAEIEHQLEAIARVGELPFVNDEADIGRARLDRVENFVERHDDVFEVAREKAAAARNALVILPGTAMFFAAQPVARSASSSRRTGEPARPRAINIGP